jgi:hypothetical protein
MVHRNAIEFVPKYREVQRELATSAMAQPIQHAHRLELGRESPHDPLQSLMTNRYGQPSERRR